MAKSSGNSVEDRDEPKFPYSLELVATIAARFADGNVSDGAATERAIKLLDAVSRRIESKAALVRMREDVERLAKETPEQLDFANGIRWITGKRTETEATKAFRDYLRVKKRLSDLGHPPNVTYEQAKALLEPLADGKAAAAENAKIGKLIARYRKKGFSQVELVRIKESYDRLQAKLMRPYQNSEKGKKGGRPRSGGKRRKKSLVRNPTPEK
jgi:hypothetical protein